MVQTPLMDDVLGRLGRHLQMGGVEMVLDVERSHGLRLVDARDGTETLDMFGFYASSALGMNHPGLADDPDVRAELAAVAVNKPSNSDVATVPLAAFVETFERVVGDPELPHLFLIEGGALAVENALKVAFDWKRQHNAAHGRDPDRGRQVLHLRQAFHGRSGYTMSLTNTDPMKIARYPRFAWPRIDTPAVVHPEHEHAAATTAAEDAALAQARAAFAAHPDDIACFIAEPIQGEGGDNHLRPRFLQAMQDLCHEHDALFVLDEVQTGGGMTGTPWAYQQLGLAPDVVAFGKKLQVCGIMGGRRVDEVDGNVFAVPGRINSTWGGNLVDIVRSRHILEIVERDDLMGNAARVGAHLLARLTELARTHDVVTNARGRGLMCAIDLPDADLRARILDDILHRERVMLLGCGERSVRFRPPLVVTEDEIDEALAALDRSIARATA